MGLESSIAHRKIVYGIGVNDSNYVTSRTINGKRVICKFYVAWKEMLGRCYSERIQKKRPTYKGCSVCEEWLTFSNFKRWMEQQDWHGKQLDKDIIKPGNKVYCPEFCAFVSREVNGVILDNKATRGDLPVGVSLHKLSGKFSASCRVNQKAFHIGLFSCPTEAHKAYKIKKAEVIQSLIEIETDARVAEGLTKHMELLNG